MPELYDITIIGGGPVGLFAAFYAHLRQAKVKIIDSLAQLGGQPAILYPEKTILDVAGFSQISAQELINRLKEQLEPFDTTICLEETVLDIQDGPEHLIIETNQGIHLSKTVLIAMGGGAFKPRPLDIEGADQFDNIHYFVSDLQQYKNQDLLVLGGGDSAVDWTLTLEPLAKSVSIAHRRDAFRALEHSVEALKNSSAQIHTPYLPQEILGAGNQAQALRLKKAKSDESIDLAFDHLFVNYGFKSSVGNLKQWDLDLKGHKILVNSKQETSRKGIYAAGDCCFYEGKVDLIATGFGEAPTAVNNAMNFINPKERVQPKHSTSL